MEAAPPSIGSGQISRSGRGPLRPRPERKQLLDRNFGAGFFERLLDLLGLFLGNAFLDGLRRALDEVLRFFQAERGDLADGLDDIDLLVAGALENNGEFRLLLDRGGGGSTGPAAAAGAAAAAAETPKRSSSALTRLARSRTDIDSICFTKSSVETAISSSKKFSCLVQSHASRSPRFHLRVCFGRRTLSAALLLRDLVDDDSEVADGAVENDREAANRMLHEIQQLRDELLARRQIGNGLDLARGNDLPVEQRALELNASGRPWRTWSAPSPAQRRRSCCTRPPSSRRRHLRAP